jgi:aromatic ring hydroxylase-like protein
MHGPYSLGLYTPCDVCLLIDSHLPRAPHGQGVGEGHPLLGRRMPDLDLVTANGPLRVFTLLHDARPVLLNLGERGDFDITPWAHRVLAIDAKYAGNWELPVLGQVAAPAAVLIRPDGYIAWVGDGTDTGLRDALTTWFGPPEAA